MLLFHALLMIALFGGFVPVGYAMEYLARHSDAPTARAAMQVLLARGRVLGPIYLAAGILGIVLARNMHISWTSPWLLTVLALFVGIFLVGMYHSRREEAIVRGLSRAGVEQAEAFERAFHGTSEETGFWVSAVLGTAMWAALFMLMFHGPSLR